MLGIYVRTSIKKEDTSIEQQAEAGVEFAQKNNFQYEIYEDKGKSAYNNNQTDEGTFKKRPAIQKLFNDIKSGKITAVYVWENSRLSRDIFDNQRIQNLFLTHKVALFDRYRHIDLTNEDEIYHNQMDTLYNRRERNKIVERTTRGVHDAINKGHRGYNSFYGYKQNGMKPDGYMNWVPVNSEIEQIKFAYEKYLGGATIQGIIEDIYKNKKIITEKNRNTFKNKWKRILTRFENTGYNLNTAGLEILNKYKKFEITDISILNDKQYYVKSLSFTAKIVSIKNWITVMKKLYKNKKIYVDKRRNVNTTMATSIITCPYCEAMWYSLTKNNSHISYQHFSKNSCLQKPKSMKVEILDDIFSVFYFYFYLVFDDTKILIKENQKIIKINLMEIQEKIKTVETDNRKIDKQIDNIQSVFENETDKNLLKLSFVKENNLNIKKEKNIDALNKLEAELDGLNKKYNADELTLTYYSVEQNIMDFFEKMAVNEKRAALIRIIKNCNLFQNYLLIEAENILFVFNIKDKLSLPQSVYNRFKTDKHFRTNFLYSGELLDKHGNYQADIQELLDMPIAKARKNIHKTKYCYSKIKCCIIL
jgi:DNA invertase Pin-like site-specific DNA recombinase